MSDPPVTVTIVESGSTYAVLLRFDTDPEHTVYALSFHVAFDAAFNAAYAYLFSADLNQNFTRPARSYRLNDPPPRQAHSNVALSDEAWHYLNDQTKLFRYNGRASHLGVSMYILALLNANPTPADWTDNRANIEPDMPEYNLERMLSGELPAWNDSDFTDESQRNWAGRRRRVRSMPTNKLRRILAMLEPIAFAHKITPHRAYTDILRNARWAGAALEAIGLQYLVPKNDPPINPMPPNPKYANRATHRNTARAHDKFPHY